jgi:hypothetical protein
LTADFTSAGYAALLAALRARGYEVRGYDDAEPARRHLVLRHDLDMSLEAALPIAALEAEAGVCATYFVLLRSEMYNVQSAASARALAAIAGEGHAIGLHFDASLYPDDDRALESAADAECAVLEQVLGRPVAMISFHRPAPRLRGRAGRLAGRRHAYEARFFAEMGYCSDSRGAWHFGAPLEHPAVAAGRALQLLTHPIWWQDGAGATVQERLDRFAHGRYQLLRAELGRHCDAYDPTRPPLVPAGGSLT